VSELVRVDDRVDALDVAARDLERHHPDQPALGVEQQRARLAVDLGPSDGGGADAGALSARATCSGSRASATTGAAPRSWTTPRFDPHRVMPTTS
jgi:hypothetical protein